MGLVSSADKSYMEELWAKIGHNALSDFRTVSISRKALSLIGNRQAQILDVGCGAGVFTLNALKLGYQVTAIDTSASQIETAGRVFKSQGLPADDLQCASLGDLIHAGRRFDAAVALDVVEHIEDRVTFLDEMRQVLKPGGRVVISVPAGPDLYDERDRLSGHYLRYKPEILREELSAAGFRIGALEYWNFLGWVHRKLKPPKNGMHEYEFRAATTLKARLLNRALLWYFLGIENCLAPPTGMSLLAVGFQE